MSYQVRTLIIIFVFCLTPLFSATERNCDNLIIDYRVEHCSQSVNNGKIYIKASAGSYPLTFKLYDLHNDNYVFSAEKTLHTESDEEALLFEGLSESAYVIQVTSSNCKKILGGLEGITISRI